MSIAASLLIAMAIELALGWPRKLHARIGHPVTWLGHLIECMDGWCNRDADSDLIRKIAGAATALVIIALAAAAGSLVTHVLPDGIFAPVLIAIAAWPLMAARSLYDHVADVAAPLGASDLPAARQAVAQIVGRDPELLDEAGVARAALESLAENTSDGVVAPIFWGLLLGLPGLAAYKAINTLDSMIGHRTPRHQMFGWAAARIDDVANLVPARLTGLLFALVSGRAKSAFTCMLQDAGHHRSKNAGWPEAAMAGGLDIRLSGPRAYGGQGMSHEPWLNDGARDATPADLARGLNLYVCAMLLLVALLAVAAAI